MKVEQLEYVTFEAGERATEVSNTSPDHGPRHWRDVARIAHLISANMDGFVVNYPFLFLFAALHDSQREDEFDDPDHGKRAAALARHLRRTNVIEMEDDDFAMLQLALIEHDRGFQYEDDLNVALCWDADRLTIQRVGHVPKREYFSLPKVRNDLDGYVKTAADVIYGPDLRWGLIAALYGERMRTDAA